jgi:hypothetical protein
VCDVTLASGFWFLGAFAKLWNSSASNGQILMKLDI